MNYYQRLAATCLTWMVVVALLEIRKEEGYLSFWVLLFIAVLAMLLWFGNYLTSYAYGDDE